MREFGTSDAQKVLNEIARQSRDQNHGLKPNTLARIKSLLSSMFTHAIQQGLLGKGAVNPVTEATIPSPHGAAEPEKCPRCGGPPDGEDTFAYSFEQVNSMLVYLPDPAPSMVAVAAYAGLGRSEIAGLSWDNYTGSQIRVTRSVWQRYVSNPKTMKSKAAVPIIKRLRQILDNYRATCGNPESGVMFATSVGTPLALNNVLIRTMLPVFKKVGICWHGWHAFRRGLATNLHALGVDDKTIQAILRHANVSVTQACYIKTLPEQSVAAMNRLDERVSLFCADHAPAQPPEPPPVIN